MAYDVEAGIGDLFPILSERKLGQWGVWRRETIKSEVWEYKKRVPIFEYIIYRGYRDPCN
jgi:hypothetical protein